MLQHYNILMKHAVAFALLALAATVAGVGAQANQPTVAPSTAGAGLVTRTIPLTRFNTVSLCAPLNILVQPGSANEYGVVVDGEEAVAEQIWANVSDGTLAISLAGPINATMRVQITVMLPADQLQAVVHAGPGADLVVASGFTADTFTASSAFGAGELYVTGLAATTVQVDSSG